MYGIDYANARIQDLHREAAARALANSIPSKPSKRRARKVISAAQIERHKLLAYSEAHAAIH